MTCSTNTYDCHWEPSPYFVHWIVGAGADDRKLIRLEWCPRCRLLRIPKEGGDR